MIGGPMNTKSKERNQLYKTFFKYVSLNVLSMIGFSAFILADTFFIANGIGKEGLVSLNLVIPAYTVIYATSLLLGMVQVPCFLFVREREEKREPMRCILCCYVLGLSLDSYIL